MKSLLVAFAFTVLCYVDFADSQAGDERFLARYASSGAYQPREPEGYNNQYHTQDDRTASGTMGNFGRDGMQNGVLRTGSNVDLQNNKEMNGNSAQTGNLPGISRTSTDGRQFDGGSAWRPVNNGGTPIGSVHGPAGQGTNIGGWNSGANVLPGLNTNGAGGGRGFNNIPNIHQAAPGNVGNLFSDLNKYGGTLNAGLIKNLISSLIQKENEGALLKSGSFADRGKARNEFVANADTSGSGGIQRSNNAGDNFPIRDFAEGYGKGPVGNGVRVPNQNGQSAIRQPDSAINVGQTAVRPENIPVAGGLPHQVSNVHNGWVANEGTRVINTPGIVQNYDSRSGLSNSNINRKPWNGPFGIVQKPFVGVQTVVRPAGIPPFAQLPAVRPGGIPPLAQLPGVRPGEIPPLDQLPGVRPGGIPPLAQLPGVRPGEIPPLAQLLGVRPGAISTGEGLLHSAEQGNSKTIGGTKIMQPNKFGITGGNQGYALAGNPGVFRGTSELNKAGTVIQVSHTSGLPKTDSIEDNGSGGLDISSQLVGSGTENVKEASVVGSNNGGDTSGITESQASNDEIHKGQKRKGKKRKDKKSKGKKGKGRKGKGRKGKGRKGKGKKSKTTSGSKSAAHANSDMQINDDEEIFEIIFREGGHAARSGGGIKECFDDE